MRRDRSLAACERLSKRSVVSVESGNGDLAERLGRLLPVRLRFAIDHAVANSVASEASAAAIVRSTSLGVWAAERKFVSNREGAR